MASVFYASGDQSSFLFQSCTLNSFNTVVPRLYPWGLFSISWAMPHWPGFYLFFHIVQLHDSASLGCISTKAVIYIWCALCKYAVICPLRLASRKSFLFLSVAFSCMTGNTCPMLRLEFAPVAVLMLVGRFALPIEKRLYWITCRVMQPAVSWLRATSLI